MRRRLPLLAAAAAPGDAACDWAAGAQAGGGVLRTIGGAGSRPQCCALCTADPNCGAATLLQNGDCALHTRMGEQSACAGCATAEVRSVAQQGGRFGHWATDEFGLPSYVYQCDQTVDSAANSVPAANARDRSATEHIFQLGNSRVTLVASNYGTFKLRQDEGGPKTLLGASDAVAGKEPVDETQFGAGFGYLRDENGSVAASTYYSGGQRDREFGVGYARTTVTGGGWKAEHVVAVPPGDDPVVLVEVRITNEGAAPRSAAWEEVWGSRMMHQDYVSTLALESLSAVTDSRLTQRRKFVDTHYRSSFANLSAPTHGVRHSREYTGLAADERVFEKLAKKKGLPLPLPKGATLWDDSPPDVFAAQLSGGSQAPWEWGTDARAFFAGGGVRAPAGAATFAASVAERDAALIARAGLTVAAGATETLCLIIGYVPPARGGAAGYAASRWKPLLFDFGAAAAPGVGPELAWHSYYLQSGVSYDDFFGEHIVDQGMSYRYSVGFQGAARDPLQHAMPLVLLQPSLAKSVLRYTLKEQPAEFDTSDPVRPVNLPYGLVGHGVVMPQGPHAPTFSKPSDLELYALLLAAEYILATKDFAVLAEEVAVYNSTATTTVLEALLRALRFSARTVGVGPHGLMRLLTSDWDDGFKPPDAAVNVSESTLNAALAAYILPRFAEALRAAGAAPEAAAEAEAFAAGQRAALLRDAWDGAWLRRAWLGDERGWVGAAAGSDGSVYSAQHGWALLGGVFDTAPAKADAAVRSVNTTCRDGWPYGFAYKCDGPTTTSSAEGGNWAAVAHPVVLGLARTNRSELAWEEFRRNSLSWQASVTPQQWAGVWTSGDMVGRGGLPGVWALPFPALCMHRHAWPLVSAVHLAGVHFTADGVLLRPAMPLSAGASHVSTPLASLRWDPARGAYEGHYHPAAPGRWVVSVDLTLRHPGRAARVHVRPRGGAAVAAATVSATAAAGAASVALPGPAAGVDFTIELA